MLDILKFIFLDFWHWLGTVVLILALGVSLNAVIVEIRGKTVSFFG